MRKRYLGDAVYADVDDLGRLVLTTENGYDATNTIVLEPDVLDALVLYTVVEGLVADAHASPSEN
jgi:hypothetical protein